MKQFSEEYLESLINEHKLVAASIIRLSDPASGAAVYARNHNHDTIVLAITQLRAKKVELEAKIDVLREFLYN